MPAGRNEGSDGRRDDSPIVRVSTILLELLRGDIGILIGKSLLSSVRHFFRSPNGIYEVLAYEACLELCDTRGEKARFMKRQRVRFLQDNVIAYQDQAWGDGEFLLDYRCSPGLPVDQYREGHKYRILISLRETKNRGDVAEFYSERTIKHGFTKALEDFQIEIDHLTHHLKMTIVFPAGRPPQQVKLMTQNQQNTIILDAQARQVLPDGRQQICWETDKLKLHEAYILRWVW
jgi:hypothetical protein